jgi:tripartite-type tricarboxylate transporter receptor subunit TctC
MHLARRSILAAAALPLPALAQGGARPIRLIVPFAPGGTTDIVARILAGHMSERLSQPLVVENRPGAGATIAAQQVAAAAPDGTTLLVSNSASHGISPALFRNIRYDAMGDFTHIALAARTSNGIFVNPRFEAQTFRDLVQVARGKPGGLDFAMSGHGTTTHLLGVRVSMASGIRLNPVPYRGSGPALIDVVGGTIGILVDGLPSSISFVRDGTLRAVVTADHERNRFLSDVPTLIESGFPGLTSYSWFGISGPRDMAPALVERLNRTVRDVLALPMVRQRYTELTAEGPDMSPGEYAAFIREEMQVWGEVVRAAGATAD